MTVTNDVIMDLLPLYVAGEASADTRRLVEERLQSDPQLARLADGIRSQLSAPPPERATLDADSARSALERTRKLLRRRTWTLAFALFFTFLPLSFAGTDGKLVFLMLRDEPGSGLFWVVALFLWAHYYVVQRKLRISNL